MVEQDDSSKRETFLTADDLLVRYRISRSKLYKLIKSANFPRGLKIGNSRRWPLSQIETYEIGALA